MTLQATMGEVQLSTGPAAHRIGVSVRITHDLASVRSDWAALSAAGIESPGQDAGFVGAWITALGIAPEDQYFIVAEQAGRPIALMALWRQRRYGLRVLRWFAGSHVGCNAPLIDAAVLGAMGSVGRAALWSSMLASIEGVDLLHLKAVPETLVDGVDLFGELGESVAADTLYRASFSSWEEADRTQRSKSRRKHDRQQGDKLDAMGEVSFEEVRGSSGLRPVVELMFRQRAARFAAMGVSDPFEGCGIRDFYESTIDPASEVDVRMHLLHLNGEIVAVRYNIAHGDRLFCLISSMSTAPEIQPGSPGKQCLLRVMQTVFDAGWRVFDMGAGLTDEKRHWCNEQIPVRDHFVALNWRGEMAGAGGRLLQGLRARIKSDPRLLGMVKAIRQRLRPPPGEPAA